MFENFIAAFPQDINLNFDLNADDLEQFTISRLGVSVPPPILEFWRTFPAGYYGDRMLYFFGCGVNEEPRESFKDWNNKIYWRDFYPLPVDGGPVFFAETAFGDQIGFRWDASECIFIIFLIDTFESFVVAQDGAQFFEETLSDRYALVDRGRYESVRSKLGPLQAGMHYAPTVSPMLGGDGEPENFAFETPNVHFATAIHAFSTGEPLQLKF